MRPKERAALRKLFILPPPRPPIKSDYVSETKIFLTEIPTQFEVSVPGLSPSTDFVSMRAVCSNCPVNANIKDTLWKSANIVVFT